MPGEFEDRKVLVMGLGRFGGCIGAARWLCAQGARVTVTDLAGEDKLAESLRALANLPIAKRLGGHDERDLDGCDLLVVSPAVDKARSSFFQEAVRRGIPWTSEMNLFLERCRGRVIGVTGTVGKSTTTAMIGAILDRAKTLADWSHGDVWLGGNIGKSLLDDLPRIGPGDLVVLELSSFQLEDAAAIRRSPHVALVTNLRDNHLDRHGTMEAYAAAKANIFLHQGADDWLLLPMGEDLSLFGDAIQRRDLVKWYGVDADHRAVMSNAPETDDHARRVPLNLALPGVHNLKNAAGALAVADLFGVDEALSRAALEEFKGLPHRLEFVGEFGGVRYYNDSKATTPEAAMTSLAAFERGRVILIVGGSDKGSDFTALGKAIADRAKAVVCIGETAGAIAGAIRAGQEGAADRTWSTAAPGCDLNEGARSTAAPGCVSRPPSAGDDRGRSPVVEIASDFSSAMSAAHRLATPGDVVLLSPACASYDWFRNYEHRGDAFRRIVRD